MAGVSPDIPWHVTAFHSDYKMGDPQTPLRRRSYVRQRSASVQDCSYIYAGNIPGGVGGLENTRCAECHELLIERHGYHIARYSITAEGCCPGCGKAVPGRWDPAFKKQVSSRPFVPRSPLSSDLISLS